MLISSIIMGVYLSEPKTDKNVITGSKNGMEFTSVEMQGIIILNQAGEKPWRTQPFMIWISEMAILCLLYSMATEVPPPLSRS